MNVPGHGRSKDEIDYSACPLCGGEDFFHQVSADCSRHSQYQPVLSPVLEWMRCRACDHSFRRGYYTPQACGVVFSTTQAVQQVGHDLSEPRLVSSRMIEKVLPFKDGGPWLDVGFGSGSLLFTAGEYGFQPVGLDLRETNVAALKRRGLEAYARDITALTFDGRFSVISMADVLEHMPFPIEGLRAAHRLMEDNGVLFLSMPNMESIVWRTMDEDRSNPYWGELEHYHNFSRRRLYALLERYGFTPVRYGISERYIACMEVIAVKGEQSL